MSTQWQVDLDADDAAAYAALAGDRVWNGYSIADLVPPFRAHAQFALAGVGDCPATAACLFLRHTIVKAIVPYGDPAGVAAILAAADLPEETGLLAHGASCGPAPPVLPVCARQPRDAADGGGPGRLPTTGRP